MKSMVTGRTMSRELDSIDAVTQLHGDVLFIMELKEDAG